MTKKEFAIRALKEYTLDPAKCGVEDGNCKYVTRDGKKCVAGKYMLHPENYNRKSIGTILKEHSQAEIFIPEVVDILTLNEWQRMQLVHDAIALERDTSIRSNIERLNLFTIEELFSN